MHFLDAIDWSRPWLAPLRALAEPMRCAADWRATLNAHAEAMGLRNHKQLPVTFVPQASLPVGTAYETFISTTGRVPTRDNLHDFFNALIWLSFPSTKIQLNALQAEALERAAVPVSGATSPMPVSRGPLRDAATIFDENAALLVVRDPEIIEPLRSHRWTEAWITQRDQFSKGYEVWLFGHALMEKLVNPFKAITAHAWVVQADEHFFAMEQPDKRRWLDRAVATSLAAGLKTSDFSPLPVLGVPGWWLGQDAHFYADASVFRPKRRLPDQGRPTPGEKKGNRAGA